MGSKESFNIAMDFHPWILNMLECFKCGWVGFNVAMDFHPWIQAAENGEAARNNGFNVAMDFHPWIPGEIINIVFVIYLALMLPWIFIHGYA